jgi:hypothetical protein
LTNLGAFAALVAITQAALVAVQNSMLPQDFTVKLLPSVRYD